MEGSRRTHGFSRTLWGVADLRGLPPHPPSSASPDSIPLSWTHYRIPPSSDPGTWLTRAVDRNGTVGVTLTVP